MTHPKRIDLDSPDAPTQLAIRAEELLILLLKAGINPLQDSTDLRLGSLLPIVIKRVLMPDPFSDVQMLAEVVCGMDLTVIEQLVQSRPSANATPSAHSAQ